MVNPERCHNVVKSGRRYNMMMCSTMVTLEKRYNMVNPGRCHNMMNPGRRRKTRETLRAKHDVPRETLQHMVKGAWTNTQLRAN